MEDGWCEGSVMRLSFGNEYFVSLDVKGFVQI